MTDNEIIKAFKDFLNEQVDGYTDHVKTGGERYEFIEKELELLKETDNLINRLQAENERLKDLCADCSMLKGKIETISDLQKQIEYLQRGYNDLRQELKTAKAEAVKEFAERLKKELSQCQREYRNVLNSDAACAMIIAKKVIDNLLKELVGEDK